MCIRLSKSCFLHFFYSDWKLTSTSLSADMEDRSATPLVQDSPPEPMEEEHRSITKDTLSLLNVKNTGDMLSLRQGSEPQQSTLARSQMTPSPILGLIQPGGYVARSPAASSTHSSQCSTEESSPGLAPSLHFLREAHHYLGRYNVIM